jgi:hypothetical protein
MSADTAPFTKAEARQASDAGWPSLLLRAKERQERQRAVRGRVGD